MNVEMIEDVEMAEMDNIEINKTPRSVVNSSNRSMYGLLNHTDSGYLSMTPQSIGSATSIATTGCRTRSGVGNAGNNTPSTATTTTTKRSYWLRSQDHWLDRRRTNLNSLIDESGDSVIEELDESNYKSSINLMNNNNNDLSMDRNEFRAELRDYRSRLRRSQRISAAVTPAFREQLKSCPLSPEIPSASFVASEPIENDVKKLVILRQSTPYELNTSNLTIPSLQITCSPKTSKTSPAITSMENQKLSKLNITDFIPSVDIKPKRLDFSEKSFHCSGGVYKHRKLTPSYIGRDTVDILSLLGEKSNHYRIIEKIFSYLSSQDLCSISMVSRLWRKLCIADYSANTRRLRHVIVRQNTKENLKLITGKNKCDNDVQQTMNCIVRKGYFVAVQNLLHVPQRRRTQPSSPPVSPSKIKFHSFVKASRTLEPWERLFPCPKCSFACSVDTENNVGMCTREGCSTKFCPYCSSQPHTGACKTPLLATPTKRKKRPLVVGSKQSKRNLRRL
ncbi:hypothetical protein PV328_005199 [Microctonus aethiopoides]|uniref:ZBR-type domain-containing protein n=1 Tax=Microctonus aethiopoides TaxID=144406 RepID=A0AA39FLV2_9HYME|nr:hypothetical protein PV328_005199 [Microctonus aethiopoides]